MRLARAALAVALALPACRRPRPSARPPPAVVRPSPALVAEGRALVARFECARCHTIDGVASPDRAQDCVGCHRAVRAGTFPARPEHLAEWRANLVDLVDAPALVAVGRRHRAPWIAAFLERPDDLRPHLRATMPRLDVSTGQARAIAAFLTRDVDASSDAPPEPSPALVARGRALFVTRTCAQCHRFDDAAIDARPVPATPPEAATLAPDLAVTRARFRRDRLVAWILDPPRLKPGTPMPALGLTREEAGALASYVLFAPLRARVSRDPPPMLPALARRVTWDEVEAGVFRRTCRHCHADEGFAFGDGGPGNTGGFGFAPRRLNLNSYSGAMSGMLVGGERRSVFAADDSGLPRLVRALRARQLEESGRVDEGVRGMPLGHPAVTPEQLQLVTSWIASGRPLE